MLEFFRKYQRYFFLVITVVVIASFSFFGTYSTFGGETERRDYVVGRAVDGSPMMLSEIQKLSRFISTDREDSLQGRGVPPNFCNNGVIRYDFLKVKLADLLVAEYFEALKGDFDARLDKAKRFRPYAHPEAPQLSAKAVWDRLIPPLSAELEALQAESVVGKSTFTHLSRLYQCQSHLQPEMLRRILVYQHQQYPWLTIDQRLSYEDLALFGFHSASDWFGHNFVDLVAEFILNVSTVAEEKGYTVSMEEAKGDLIHHFVESMEKLAEVKAKSDLNFHEHLRMIGFDEKSACEVWRKVMLFRAYFSDVGESAFVDRLPYRDFASYAQEAAVVDKYEWPKALRLKSGQDLAELQFYLKAVCAKSKEAWPISLLSVEEVEKKYPELVQTTYRAKVAEISKQQVGLRPSLKEVWEWQMSEENWETLRKEFSLPQAATRDERFTTLEKLDGKVRAQVDAFSRNHLVDQHPDWIEEAFAGAPIVDKTWAISANEAPTLHEEGMLYRIADLEKVDEKHILTFAQARGVLAKLVGKVEGACDKEKNPFVTASNRALADLQKDPADSRWIQSGNDPLADQFKLERKEIAIQRTSQESWMKEQAFLMLPEIWSPVHMDDEGQIVFFYLKEKKVNQAPILDQLNFGKETLAADAQRYVTERFLQTIKKKNAIVIPVQKEDD
ncbi:MAG TPA: hypothetical protein VLF94_09090 [Chlamydiales bacterium]|nr:hypothetical protein [Chlamydiales bacterium]